VVPLAAPLFQRMARVVRIWRSRAQGGAIATEGEDTEIDRNMVDHQRTAAAHAAQRHRPRIEPAADRLAAGSQSRHGAAAAYHSGSTW